MSKGIIEQGKTAFILIDIQERLAPAMLNMDEVFKNVNILTESSETLEIPLIVTEQYPKGLGNTCTDISIPDSTGICEKTSFSCFGCDEFINSLSPNCNSIVLFGIETHVCVLQTALDGLKKGMEVHIVADAVSSRTQQNKQLGIERMRQSGAFIVSTEMILFQLLTGAGSEEFKKISKLIR